MEAIWLTVESKVERCDWFGYQPPTAVGLHRRGQSRTPHKVNWGVAGMLLFRLPRLKRGADIGCPLRPWGA